MISQTVSAIDRFKNESFEIYALYFLYPNFLKLFVFYMLPAFCKKAQIKSQLFTNIIL
jgi:hypothetical protein